MRKATKTYLPLLLLALTFVSVNQWNPIPIGNTFTTWVILFATIIAFLIEKKRNQISFFQREYLSVTAFLICAAIGFLRGCNTAENYWEWKNLVSNSFILSVPLSVFAFSSPVIVKRSLSFWLVYALIAYAAFFVWLISISQFYLGPIYLVGCFFPLLPRKYWKPIIAILLISLLLYKYQDSRSQSIKAIVTISLSMACFFKRFFKPFVLKIIHWAFYIIPCVFLYLGLSGQYNVFEEMNKEYAGQSYIEQEDEEGFVVRTDIAADTRTFIYQEVTLSAIEHDYWLFGRTQARGNDTSFFYDIAEQLKSTRFAYNIKHERPRNEVCFPNIFTWLGLVGMFLYILIYLQASVLALYRSNNFYIKIAGLYTAFNFLYGWVENITSFDILNITYWIAIAMCLSPQFRNMTDHEFKKWFVSIFNIRQQPTRRINPYLP